MRAYLLLIAFFASCSGGAKFQPPPEDSIRLRIFVDKDGLVYTNSRLSNFEMLAFSLDTLSKKNGVVYYSRDNIAAEPPMNAITVVELIAEFGMPVKFFTDSTFSKQVHH